MIDVKDVFNSSELNKMILMKNLIKRNRLEGGIDALSKCFRMDLDTDKVKLNCMK